MQALKSILRSFPFRFTPIHTHSNMKDDSCQPGFAVVALIYTEWTKETKKIRMKQWLGKEVSQLLLTPLLHHLSVLLHSFADKSEICQMHEKLTSFIQLM